MPQLVRALLLYRYQRLEQARRAAHDAGYDGAMFPWQSASNGRENVRFLLFRRLLPKQVGPRLVAERMVGKFWEENAGVRDALVAQNNSDTAKNGRTVENELLAFIDQHFAADTPVLLAGNSIHQDRRFIMNEWPRLDARLHYRMLDVTAWKVVFEGKYRRKFATTVRPMPH